MKPALRLFDAETIDTLPWPDTEEGRYARKYLVPLVQHSPAHFIENVQTSYMILLIAEEIILPISINENEYANSYVCSPYTHYITYAREELVVIQQAWLRKALSLLIDIFSSFCKWCQINRTVYVNNWLLSTNLYPELDSAYSAAILEFLAERFPRHSIVFRSLNTYSNKSLLGALQESGCALVPGRQVYLVHPSDPTGIPAKARWLLKRDLGLLHKQGYAVLDAEAIADEDVPRLVELYNALYLQKYSLCNPMFNERFLLLALRQKILHLVALKKDGRIDAVLGYFCRNGIMTTPLFGYDTTLPQEIGLYRMLSAVLFTRARENGHLLNESSGAAQFKRNRGAVGVIEYSAAYTRHVSWRRRLCWSTLATLLERVGVPLLKKYKF